MRKSPYSAVKGIGPAALERRTEVRGRYSDEEILADLRDCAARLDRSPTMQEFLTDPKTHAHPQTVIGHFGSWNAAKRRAGLVPRRSATREELLSQLQDLGRRLGRTPTSRDLREHRSSMPSKSLLWQTFGSLRGALREAGFDVPVGQERVERAITQGTLMARRLGHLPRFAEWGQARRADPGLLTEWQVYRLFGAKRGGWSALQHLVRERLQQEGARVSAEGVVEI